MKLIQKSKKSLIILLLAIVLLLGGLAYYVFALNGSLFGWQFRQQPTSEQPANINLDPPSDEEKSTGASIKEQTVENEKTPSNDPKQSTSFSVHLTAVNQNTDTLQVRAMTDQLLQKGTCTLTLTKDSQTVTKTAATYPTASVTTCQGFDVPTAELSVGIWNIKIEVNAEGKTGQATTTTQIN